MQHIFYPCAVCNKLEFDTVFTRGIYFDKIFIAICKNCGLVCQNPRMPEDFFRHYYSGGNYYGQYQARINSAVGNQDRASMIFKHVRKLCSKSSRILEIGAGRGANLLTFQKFGYTNLFATETNLASASLIRKHKIPTYTGELEKYAATQPFKFDLIVLSHVLEHFVEPDKKLTTIHSLLNKSGCLYVLVPNFFSPTNTFNQFTLPHIHYFSVNSLSNLLKISNFSVSKIKTINKSEIYALAKKI